MTTSKHAHTHPHEHGHEHAHNHEHNHCHSTGHRHVHLPKDRSNRSFAIAFFANLIFAFVELIGGVLAQSYAITADAVHDFGDSLSIGIAWWLENFSRRGRTESFNFGYRRFSLLAALISGVVISVGALGVLVSSILSFSTPKEPVTWGMALLAVLGILVNGGASLALNRGAGATQNEKVLSWHLLEDLLGWVVVLVGAGLIYLTKWNWIDPVLAILLSLYILWNISKSLRETIYLLLQGRPMSFSEENFKREALANKHVDSIDSIHVWSLDGVKAVMSFRIHLHSLDDRKQVEALKAKLRHLALHHGVDSDNITIETCLAASCSEPETLVTTHSENDSK
ncbi:MAG: cation transporter [Deltaproteobacteria bacterium]|nr:cation transporter [Deltaproteobacteria bacterium]